MQKKKKLLVLFRVAVVVKGDNQQQLNKWVEGAERQNAFEIYDVTM